MSLHNYKMIINIEQLDKLMDSVSGANNPVSWVIAAIKLLIFALYLVIRVKLIDLEMMIKKQEDEAIKEKQDESDVDIILG